MFFSEGNISINAFLEIKLFFCGYLLSDDLPVEVILYSPFFYIISKCNILNAVKKIVLF